MTGALAAHALVRRGGRFALVVALGLLAVACGGSSTQEPPQPAGDVAFGDSSNPAGASDADFQIAFLGDSLTAGYGLTSQEAYPSRVGELLAADGYSSVEVINGGVTGDTSAGGVRRVDQFLTPNVRILVVALGANDALRGLSVTQTHDNLAAIIDRAEGHGTHVVLAGMEAPTNYGTDYRDAFRDVFLQLGLKYSKTIAFVPFLLEGVAGDPTLNQADGIHPNADGAAVIARQLYPVLKRLVDELAG